MNRIGDYGIIGDCHSLALVGRDGSIDWACFPRFDSPSVFGRALGADAGHFKLAPAQAFHAVRRTYLPSTNVLATTFVTAEGDLEITDCMPVNRFDAERPTAVFNHSSVLRRLDEAETLLDRLLSLSNDVGLYAEMVDPATGEHLGNTPQAFTHMAVVTSCSAMSAARRGQLPPADTAFSFIEAALDRRMSAFES